EARACPIRRQDLDSWRVGGFSRRRRDGRRRHRCALGSRLWGSFCGGRGECRRARGSRTLQEPATTDRWLIRFHVILSRSSKELVKKYDVERRTRRTRRKTLSIFLCGFRGFCVVRDFAAALKPSHSISFG